jgi:hypothetical protein
LKILKADGTEDATTLLIEGKVTINNFYLRVPIMEYNSDAKNNLINDLLKENYIFLLKKWQCIQHMKLTGKSLDFDITNIYKNVTNPLWAFVVFQTNRFNNQQKDNNTFDHVDVKNLWLEIGGKRYPEESLDLDWNNYYYCSAYNVSQDYKKVFIQSADSIPYISKKDFKNLYPIYSIDLSYQPQKISDTKTNIILHVDFNKYTSNPTGTDEGTVCFIIVVPKSLLLYEPVKNRITKKIN